MFVLNKKWMHLVKCFLMAFLSLLERYGFNSEGIDSVKKRLQKRCDVQRTGIVGVNVGKNKSTENAVEDFTQGIKELGEFADYVVVNVSSPNTPGLRKMQGKEQLKSLILEVIHFSFCHFFLERQKMLCFSEFLSIFLEC